MWGEKDLRMTVPEINEPILGPRIKPKSVEAASCVIKHFEGLFLKAYVCPAGKKTIGYGHLVKKGEVWASEITKYQAEEILKSDINGCFQTLSRLVSKPLNCHESAALVSFIFNLGGGVFRASALRRKVNRGDKLGASHEFLKWVYAGGIRLRGLIRRRKVEKNLFESDCLCCHPLKRA